MPNLDFVKSTTIIYPNYYIKDITSFKNIWIRINIKERIKETNEIYLDKNDED